MNAETTAALFYAVQRLETAVVAAAAANLISDTAAQLLVGCIDTCAADLTSAGTPGPRPISKAPPSQHMPAADPTPYHITPEQTAAVDDTFNFGE